MDNNSNHPNPEPSAPADPMAPTSVTPTSETTPATEPAEKALSPAIMVIGFIMLVLLSVLVFLNVLPSHPAEHKSEESPTMRALKADVQSRQREINRKRVEMGLQPMIGSDTVESADELAARLKTDADSLSALVGSIQKLLLEKDLQIDQARDESMTALKEQQRLRELLNTTNNDLRRALVDASLATTIQTDLDKANQRIQTMEQELLRARSVPADINERLNAAEIENERMRAENEQLKAELARLRSQLDHASIFAGTEDQIIADAIALFQALKKLEGKSDSEIATAYSQYGAKLGANVMKTCTFATGSSELSPELEQSISAIPPEVPDNSVIFVVGYASSTGATDNNRALSSDRATRVARLLDSIKRPSQRVQAAYLGQTNRFSSNIPERNQIVEIWQISPKTP